jgi:DNA-binding MarR family transcriptional regulator
MAAPIYGADALEQRMTEDTEPTPRAPATKSGSTRDLNAGLMADRLSFRVRSVMSLLGDRVVAAFAPFRLRSGSFTSLALIAANPGCSQKDLAREGGLDKSSLVAIVDELEKRGLAIRAKSPTDRRRSSLFLTPEGEKVMHEMYAVAMGTETSIRDGLTTDEVAQLFHLLERVYQILAREDLVHD